MLKKIAQYLRGMEAATAIEYGLLGAGIALAIAGVMVLLGHQIHDIFEATLAGMTQAATNIPNSN